MNDSDIGHPEHEPVRYWWFDGATIAALRDRLNAVLGKPDAYLTVTPQGRELFLDVIDPGQDVAARLGPLNESHICPPDCR